MTMSTPTTAAPSAQRVAVPATPPETLLWTNGVKRTHTKGLDTYELPNTRPGVAASFTVQPRWGGLRAPVVRAVDAQGRRLETAAHEHVDARGNVTFNADAFERASGFTPIVAGAVFRTRGVEVTTFPADKSRPTALLREGDDRNAWLWCGLPCFVSSASSVVDRTALRASAPEADGRFTVMDPQTGQVRQRQLFVGP